MAGKTEGTVSGGNDELSAQQAARLTDAKKAQEAAEADKKAADELEKAHNKGTAGDEALAQDAPVGGDGENAVSFFNPAPKAVRNRDTSGEVSYSSEADKK